MKIKKFSKNGLEVEDLVCSSVLPKRTWWGTIPSESTSLGDGMGVPDAVLVLSSWPG